jgi:hypothetical protein
VRALRLSVPCRDAPVGRVRDDDADDDAEDAEDDDSQFERRQVALHRREHALLRALFDSVRHLVSLLVLLRRSAEPGLRNVSADLGAELHLPCPPGNQKVGCLTLQLPVLPDKVRAIARPVYGADDVHLLPLAEERIARFAEQGLGELPICMAKTHLSLSDDPTLLNAPTGFTVHVRDVRAHTGAGWLVPLCGEIMTMPRLGRKAAAIDVDIDEHGRTVGLF